MNGLLDHLARETTYYGWASRHTLEVFFMMGSRWVTATVDVAARKRRLYFDAAWGRSRFRLVPR